MRHSIIHRRQRRRRGEFKVFNHPSKMANEKANEFIRKLEKGKVVAITSANEKKTIKFKMLEDGYIYLLTEQGEMKEGNLKDKCQKISISTLKHACYEFLYLKTVTRAEFEKYSRYWSSLFALLITVFFDSLKKHRTPKGAIRITLIGSRVFFSGLSAASNIDWEAIRENGSAFILLAFPDIKRTDNWIKKLNEYNVDKIMLDSGVFGYINAIKKGKKATYPNLNEYCDFINKNKDLLSHVINLDHLEPEKADENQKLIYHKTGIRPVPVWHPGDTFMDHDWDRLDVLVKDDYPLIAIGKTVGKGEDYKKEIFNEIFRRYPNQNFHWLGGNSQLLLDYNWFSSDATTWWKGREEKPQLTVFEGFKATTKRLHEGVLTREEGLTFNIQMIQNIEYMNWSTFKRTPDKAPFPDLKDLWGRVYDAKRAKIDSSKSKNLEKSTYKQIELFDEELVG
ncbi:hypothetical protein QTG56_23925 (plasmid) [Rossellomorea sp. AcN35-11]|nr:hypothetical protein [Rossellomorea aquimaris]WJV31687.1 hypothetical protein QTG56_23925 [Rossellomorea sp. AcN35-11]